MNLADGILIKDNHIAALRSRGLSLKETVALALERASHTVKVEVEVTNLEELGEALEAGAHIIMLDNMSLDAMRQGVEMVNGRAVLEASGGINMETARAVAETGVDLISIGGLTHSVKGPGYKPGPGVQPGGRLMPAIDAPRTALERNWVMIDSALEGLDDETLARIPAEQCNSIAWMIWHLNRVMDTFIHTGPSGSAPTLDYRWMVRKVRHGG